MALIPPFFTDCVLAIGTYDRDENPVWVASGFLYGHLLEKLDEERGRYRVYLITNRHVFSELKTACIRMNPKADEPARVYSLDLLDKDGKPSWLTSERDEVDIAVMPINFQKMKEELLQVRYFMGDHHAAPIAKIKELGICEGDFAYVLGFPLALVGERRNTVIVRSGAIARIRDTLADANPEFLVDAFVFPGNSGGPVISKPESIAIKGTQSQDSAHLIGIVKSYVPYRDVAVSQQTGEVRVIFEENSGLTAAHPIDYIDDVVRRHAEMMEAEGAEEPPPEEPVAGGAAA